MKSPRMYAHSLWTLVYVILSLVIVVADVKKSILGANFLSNFGLLVDVR